jgi:hypothetical protein
MKFKLDPNLPAEAETILARAGHDVVTALAEGLGGHADAKLAAEPLARRLWIVEEHRVRIRPGEQ